MTIASEITRLQWAKADIKTSIEWKGVSVPSSAKIDTYSTYIDQITTGGITSTMPIRCYLEYYWNKWLRAAMWCPLSFIYGDYIFWIVFGCSFNSSYDYPEANFFAFKKWWTDFKQKRNDNSAYIRSWNSLYGKSGWYILNNNSTITLWVGYGASQWTAPYSTLTATFSFTTNEWTSVWTGTDEWLTTHWNDLFNDLYFDPVTYNFYGTEIPIAVCPPKTLI